jgi:hypothetical protein
MIELVLMTAVAPWNRNNVPVLRMACECMHDVAQRSQRRVLYPSCTWHRNQT